MNRLAELLRELKNHVGETYNTLDKGSTGKNIRHDANALAKTLKSAFPMLEKDPQYVGADDLINSGFGVMPLSTKLPATAFSKAHALAQKNAALPIEQGGLGLHPDNTAMERARALGFDVDNPVYHGTNADINEFNLNYSGSASGAEQYGSGIYTTTSPSSAGGYANPNIEGANIMQLLVNLKNPIVDGTKGQLTKPQIRSILQKAPELDDALWNFGDVGYEGKNKVFNTALNQVHEYQGEKLLENLHPISNDFFNGHNQAFNDAAAKVLKKDGVQVNFDNGEKYKIPWNPKQVRSRFAAFDPMQKNSANILASLLLGIGLAKDEK